jgi:hypothetical protein
MFVRLGRDAPAKLEYSKTVSQKRRKATKILGDTHALFLEAI